MALIKSGATLKLGLLLPDSGAHAGASLARIRVMAAWFGVFRGVCVVMSL